MVPGSLRASSGGKGWVTADQVGRGQLWRCVTASWPGDRGPQVNGAARVGAVGAAAADSGGCNPHTAMGCDFQKSSVVENTIVIDFQWQESC